MKIDIIMECSLTRWGSMGPFYGSLNGKKMEEKKLAVVITVRYGKNVAL